MILSYKLQDPAAALVVIPVRNDARAKTINGHGWVISDLRLVLPDSISTWRLTLGVGLDAATITGPAVTLAASNTSIITPLAATPPSTIEYTRIIPNLGLPISEHDCDWGESHELRLDVDAAPASWANAKIQFTIRQLPHTSKPS